MTASKTSDETGDNHRVRTFRFLEAAHYWAPGINEVPPLPLDVLQEGIA